MKFLIHGNAPHVKTGYGVQAAQLVERLVADGHEVAVSCTYGQQGGIGTWRGVRLYPAGYEVNGNDVLHSHALHWFEGDPLGGWIITLVDVWCLQNPVFADFNIAAWCPVDHFPVPPQVLKFFERTDAVPLAMSQFGFDELAKAGLDPVYLPLAVDTRQIKRTPTVDLNGRAVTGADYFEIPDRFVVGMVGMNKGWARDRKGFNEAFRGFARFHHEQPDSVLVVHAEKFGGADGMDLVELAQHAGIPPDAIVFTDQYAYRLGQPAEAMAALYSSMDVLLAPSHGEGFCVPLVEAQACGVPVIASDFTAQSELIGVGVKLGGQAEWDPAQHASYLCPSIAEITAALHTAYDLRGDQEVADQAVKWAQQYDADRVYVELWRPFLESLDPAPDLPEYDRVPLEADGSNLDVIVPLMRPENLDRLLCSLNATAPRAQPVLVYDTGFDVNQAYDIDVAIAAHCTGEALSTYARKVALGAAGSHEPWLLVVGDDVEFHPGWVEAAAKRSYGFDVIGTNDSLPGRVRNPEVANGSHADHFFVRRAYLDAVGASLDGPGTLATTAYHHWFVDKEIIGLAKARGVFSPCLDSVVEHHHPGYDGQPRDAVYMAALDHAAEDQETWRKRAPLIEMQRTGRGKRR